MVTHAHPVVVSSYPRDGSFYYKPMNDPWPYRHRRNLEKEEAEKMCCIVTLFRKTPKEQCRNTYGDEALGKVAAKPGCGPTFDEVYAKVNS